MLNREKYAEQILDIACSGNKIAMENGKLRKCSGLYCDKCDFNDAIRNCNNKIQIWANSEYVEPPVDWSKVAVDTPILVRDDEDDEWRPRYFAKYEDGKVHAWNGGTTSWTSCGGANPWDYAKFAEREDADA